MRLATRLDSSAGLIALLQGRISAAESALWRHSSLQVSVALDNWLKCAL